MMSLHPRYMSQQLESYTCKLNRIEDTLLEMRLMSLNGALNLDLEAINLQLREVRAEMASIEAEIKAMEEVDEIPKDRLFSPGWEA